MERLQRRQKVCRVPASLCWFLALILLGIAIGKML